MPRRSSYPQSMNERAKKTKNGSNASIANYSQT
ncbi:unnamed protein product, partial [Onchocerca flexuosa]|uniref:Uncharacterized protein n=1 Tax=Onchocerca flexuosa TaxID=387005 RepID=A0A183HVD1_9BILA